MICRKKGLLEIAERNQIKEGAISGLTYLAIASKKASSTVTTNNADNKNLLPFLGSLQETVTLGNDKCVRDFWKVHLELFGKMSKFWKFLQIQLVQRENRICWKFLEIHFAASATWFLPASLNLSIATSEKEQIFIQSHHSHLSGVVQNFRATSVVQHF